MHVACGSRVHCFNKSVPFHLHAFPRARLQVNARRPLDKSRREEFLVVFDTGSGNLVLPDRHARVALLFFLHRTFAPVPTMQLGNPKNAGWVDCFFRVAFSDWLPLEANRKRFGGTPVFVGLHPNWCRILSIHGISLEATKKQVHGSQGSLHVLWEFARNPTQNWCMEVR